MWKVPLKLLLFAVLCFCMIEQSYRVLSVGAIAFNPVRLNSLNILLLTDFIEPTEQPGIPYRLKADVDGWFQGERLQTNSFGLADREYAQSKPDDTFRVAVVGSSWTMATAVEQKDIYHSVMERRLSAEGQSMEFLNFGVEYYGLRELVATAKYEVPQWQPDALLVAITNFTAHMRWLDPSEDKPLPAKTNPFFQSFALRGLDQVLGSRRFARGLPEVRPVLGSDEDELYKAQLRRALTELAGVAAELDVPLTVVWLSYYTPGPDIEALLMAEAERLDIVIVKGYRVLGGADSAELQVAYNKHPNVAGHKRIADLLEEEMRAAGVLPVSANRTAPGLQGS